MKRNPKQEGSCLFDCRPQIGLCPINCNQCFYNRPGAFYTDINKPDIPTIKEVGDGIVRMNCGHDSNLQRNLVIETAKQYKHFFFNTSIPNLGFPGPVVLTANPKEEETYIRPVGCKGSLDNLMFIRLRVSASNLKLIEAAIKSWNHFDIPIVLTFMAYYEKDKVPNYKYYEWKVRHINSYYCPTKEFITNILKQMEKIGGRLVTLCGTLTSNYCKDCRNCETYYWQTMKYIQGYK